MAKKYYTVKFQEFLDMFETKFQEYITHVMTQWFIRLEFLNFNIDTFGKPQLTSPQGLVLLLHISAL